jgi:hypothetical protein
VVPQELMDVIKQVLLSWYVIAATVGFLLFRALVNAVVNPRKPKPHLDKSIKTKRVKRPPAEKSELDKGTDTEDLNLGN